MKKSIKNVQVALYIFTNQSDSNMTEVKYNENRFVIVSKSKKCYKPTKTDSETLNLNSPFEFEEKLLEQ